MRSRPLQRQKGIVLLVALIMLVAMSLAGVALMRSVETGVMVSGNFAFKESAVQSTDLGVQTAAAWLSTTYLADSGSLFESNTAAGYFAALPSKDPDYFSESAWTDAYAVNGGAADAAGNKVRYIVHRMCTVASLSWSDPDNECALQTTAASEGEGSSKRPGAPPPSGNPILYYRVTTRVDGPRGTVTVTQTSLAQKI
ncbi:hypothetical protein BWI17_08430 [Betaproteobacteria bacterium GR16-43]|nr:hypothetical protein BWI17_08430 [Betaproteobacteria bacterium GR16-43]